MDKPVDATSAEVEDNVTRLLAELLASVLMTEVVADQLTSTIRAVTQLLEPLDEGGLSDLCQRLRDVLRDVLAGSREGA